MPADQSANPNAVFIEFMHEAWRYHAKLTAAGRAPTTFPLTAEEKRRLEWAAGNCSWPSMRTAFPKAQTLAGMKIVASADASAERG